MPHITANYSTWLAKRFFDIIGACLILLLLAPILPIIAAIIKLTSSGTVFYYQLRVGKSMPNQMVLFNIIKFRTMFQDAESHSGAVWATKNDPRITPAGRFLRKTRLDEIPQLFNVLKVTCL